MDTWVATANEEHFGQGWFGGTFNRPGRAENICCLDVRTAQELLGYKDRAASTIYTHVLNQLRLANKNSAD